MGHPFYGFPALDYGDGSTVSTTAVLTNAGGGPGGSNVYRTMTSFSHTYPTRDNYTATASLECVACVRASSVFFPPGSPVPNTFTMTFRAIPSTVLVHHLFPRIPFYRYGWSFREVRETLAAKGAPIVDLAKGRTDSEPRTSP